MLNDYLFLWSSPWDICPGFSFGGCLNTHLLQCHLLSVPYALVNLDILIGSQVNHDVVVSEEKYDSTWITQLTNFVKIGYLFIYTGKQLYILNIFHYIL